MSDINGHEVANGYPHNPAGFSLMLVDDSTSASLTKQQNVILRHLQERGSITAQVAKAEYRCACVHAVISVLRKKGWNIETYRGMGEAGASLYKLEEDQDVVNHTPDMLSDTVADAEEHVEDPQGELPKPQNPRRSAASDIIKNHLTTGERISAQTAMELYGMTGGSLTGAICRLRKNEKLDIVSIAPSGDEKHTFYHLASSHDDTETRNVAIDASGNANMDPLSSREAEARISAKHVEMERQSIDCVDVPAILRAPAKKIRFIVPLSASESSVTLTRADFDFMMQIVNAEG